MMRKDEIDDAMTLRLRAHDYELRARKAHERMHGASTYIEARYMPSLNKVRVADHELGIVTYWDIQKGKRKIKFEKQLGERN